MTERRILIVAPHPLDEVLGCGGTAARHARDGDRVSCVYLVGGQDGRHRVLADMAKRAAEILGFERQAFSDLPENRLDTVPLAEIVGTIEANLESVRPDTVYVPHGGNLNVDHGLASRAAITACRPLPGSPVRELLAYEIASSTDWAPAGTAFAAFRPTWFVDIAATLDLKLAALDAYAAEMRPPPHARSRDALETLARRRGASVGFAAAETFALLRRTLPDVADAGAIATPDPRP